LRGVALPLHARFLARDKKLEPRNDKTPLSAFEEAADTQANLHGIDAGIGNTEAGVGNVKIANFHIPIVFGAENVGAEGERGHEIHVIGSGGNILIGKEDATAEFEVGRDGTAGGKIPFQVERIESSSISSVVFLENNEGWNGVQSILEAPFQEAGAMRTGENPTVAQTCIPNASIATATRDGVSATGPDGDFVAIGFGTSLGVQGRRQNANAEEDGDEFSHDG